MCGVTAWSTDSSALCGGLMVCVFVWMHFFVFFLMRVCARFFFPVFALLVWWFCVCLYHRCCPGRRVVFSHTPSSIKTTQAVRMNWTSSSMEESYSSLFYWTLWVKYISTQLLSCTLGHPFNWRWKLKYHRNRAVTHAAMTASCFPLLHYLEGFFYWSKHAMLKTPLICQYVLFWGDTKR